MSVFEKISDDMSINQNVIIAIVFYIGMAYASKYGLDCLTCLCMFVFVLCVISVSISLVFYTIEYARKKWYKSKFYYVKYQQCKRCGECEIYPCKEKCDEAKKKQEDKKITTSDNK